MEPNEVLGGVKHAADLKIALGLRIHALEKGLKRIREELCGLDARLKSMGSDLEIIKEHLVTEMRPSKNEDENDLKEGETAKCSCKLRIDPQFVAKSLNLTPKQSLVAVALAEGSSVRDIAVATGREESTIRWFVREIHHKLGISRQTQLVRMVLLLPCRNG